MKDTILFGISAALIGLIIYAAIALIIGLIVMLLWNWLMPEIFGLGTINYIQGWGISFLCGMLFKGTSNATSKSED